MGPALQVRGRGTQIRHHRAHDSVPATLAGAWREEDVSHDVGEPAACESRLRAIAICPPPRSQAAVEIFACTPKFRAGIALIGGCDVGAADDDDDWFSPSLTSTPSPVAAGCACASSSGGSSSICAGEDTESDCEWWNSCAWSCDDDVAADVGTSPSTSVCACASSSGGSSSICAGEDTESDCEWWNSCAWSCDDDASRRTLAEAVVSEPLAEAVVSEPRRALATTCSCSGSSICTGEDTESDCNWWGSSCSWDCVTPAPSAAPSPRPTDPIPTPQPTVPRPSPSPSAPPTATRAPSIAPSATPTAPTAAPSAGEACVSCSDIEQYGAWVGLAVAIFLFITLALPCQCFILIAKAAPVGSLEDAEHRYDDDGNLVDYDDKMCVVPRAPPPFPRRTLGSW